MNLVFLHGWGCDRRHWQPLLEALDGSAGEHKVRPYGSVAVLELPGFGEKTGGSWPEDEVLLQQLYEQLPEDCLLVGHSLGGMLAARLAAQPGQDKISALITIAANGSFVRRGDWQGMDSQVFADFRRALDSAPEATWEKFCGLQARGDTAMRQLLKQLKNLRPRAIGPAWGEALATLGRLDNRELLAEVSVPALHLFGERDALVPASVAAQLAAQNLPVEVLEGCGHALQISHPELIAQKLHVFLRANTRFAPTVNGDARRRGEPCVRLPESDESPCEVTPFDKSAVARSFGRAAASYDAAAHLQRAVCRQLLNTAEDNWTPKRILDLGSGTGYGSELLRRHFPQAEIIALDLAEGMLQYARAERPAADRYIAADAEQLPLADNSIDLVFSSMALQWCYRLPQLFGELQRVLIDGGHCLVATLGPGTLRELKDSWARVDGAVHVNRFLPRSEWLDAAIAGDLASSLNTEERVLHFDDVRQLMRELKNIGAHNVNRAAGRGLMSRAKLRRLAAAYEPLRTEVGLPASYEVIYLKLVRSVDEIAVGAVRPGAAHGRDRIIR